MRASLLAVRFSLLIHVVQLNNVCAMEMNVIRQFMLQTLGDLSVLHREPSSSTTAFDLPPTTPHSARRAPGATLSCLNLPFFERYVSRCCHSTITCSNTIALTSTATIARHCVASCFYR